MKKKGVLLINLGTPDSPGVGSVGPYLLEFLNDGRVIDIPWLLRKILVSFIIVPIRMFGSSSEYKKLWTDKGSPLLFHSEDLTKKVQEYLGDDYDVRLAMRYNKPSIKSVLKSMREEHHEELIIVPLYPQHASSSSGTAIEEALKYISKWWTIPSFKVISAFHNDAGYIESFANRARLFDLDSYDHILFSYHGVPNRHIKKCEIPKCAVNDCDCAGNRVNNRYCYRANCFETTQLLADTLKLDHSKYSVCFQSRLDKKWLTPFADKEIERLAKSGSKRVLVFSPAFVADCLETIVEIGEGLEELFQENGGEKLDLVPSLNSGDDWVEALSQLIKKY